MGSDLSSFKEFMKQREEAARAYVCGDSSLLEDLVSTASPATFFSPRGDQCQGAEDVWSRYDRDSKLFEAGSETHFEILHMDARDDIAYWVGFQKAVAKIRGKDELIPMVLRVTELFRKENGEWKLVHRHADFQQ